MPAQVLLGSKPVGATAEGFVVLQASTGLEFTVERVEADSPEVRVEPVEADGFPAGRTFRVVQRVTLAGDQSSAVRFRVRKTAGDRLVVPVEVLYRGEAGGGPAPGQVERRLP